MTGGARLGADPAALDEVAAVLRRVATELGGRPRWDRAADRIGWTGPDAARLWRLLDGAATARRRAGADLERFARALASAATGQRRASRSAARVAVTVDRAADGGRLVQRVGPAGAAVVVVVVPGVGSDRGDRSRFLADARRIWRDLTDRVDDPESVAVVSWLGYDPPDRFVGALDVRPAVEGAESLGAAVDEIRAGGADVVVVVGHSYGGVVAGRAAAAGMDADAVVELGSPGSGAPGAAAAIAARGIALRAVRERGDPIGVVVDRLPGLYGEDPVGQVPGLPTSGSGHSAYLADGVLLDALAELVLGYRRTP